MCCVCYVLFCFGGEWGFLCFEHNRHLEFYVFSVSVMLIIISILITSVLSACSLLVITSIMLVRGPPSFKSLNILLLCKVMLLSEILGNLYMSHFLLTLVVIELGSLWLHSRSSGLNWKFQVQFLHQRWYQQLLADSAWISLTVCFCCWLWQWCGSLLDVSFCLWLRCPLGSFPDFLNRPK